MSVSTAVKPSESPHISPGESSRASRAKNKLAKTPSSPCVLPILEGGKPQVDDIRHEIMDTSGRSDVLDRDKTFLTGMNDFIPDDILNSLTQHPIPPSREQLGPPTKHKKLKPLEVILMCLNKINDYSAQRSRTAVLNILVVLCTCTTDCRLCNNVPCIPERYAVVSLQGRFATQLFCYNVMYKNVIAGKKLSYLFLCFTMFA